MEYTMRPVQFLGEQTPIMSSVQQWELYRIAELLHGKDETSWERAAFDPFFQHGGNCRNFLDLVLAGEEFLPGALRSLYKISRGGTLPRVMGQSHLWSAAGGLTDEQFTPAGFALWSAHIGHRMVGATAQLQLLRMLYADRIQLALAGQYFPTQMWDEAVSWPIYREYLVRDQYRFIMHRADTERLGQMLAASPNRPSNANLKNRFEADTARLTQVATMRIRDNLHVWLPEVISVDEYAEVRTFADDILMGLYADRLAAFDE